MIDFSGSITRKTKVAEVLVWAGAVVVSFGLHTGTVAWMLRAEPVVIGDNAPAAIMIEIAAAPEAMQTEKDEIAPDQKPAEESIPQEDHKAEKPVEPVIEPGVEEPVAEEIVKEKLVQLDKVEVPLPAAQPTPEKKEPKKEKPKEKKPQARKQQAAADSKAAQQAQVQTRQSDRTAAAQTVSGVSSMSPANWQSLLMAHLERRKRYPAGASERGARGIAYVRFTIDGAGNVLSANLVRSSGFSELDQETVSLVRRASPVPAPPPGANRTITVPVRFNVN
jgi:protein TonB